MICVSLDGITTFCELQLRLWDDLVEGESTTTEDLAGVAMAMDRLECELKIIHESIPENVLLLIWLELNSPGGLATMAFSVVGSHVFEEIGSVA
jgi:hypothetical protein